MTSYLTVTSALAIMAGIAILIVPSVLSYVVAIYLVIFGIFGLSQGLLL